MTEASTSARPGRTKRVTIKIAVNVDAEPLARWLADKKGTQRSTFPTNFKEREDLLEENALLSGEQVAKNGHSRNQSNSREGETQLECFESGHVPLEHYVKIHERMNTAKKPLERLSKRLEISSELKRHGRIRTGKTLCKFPERGKAFSDSVDLKRRRCIDTDEKMFESSECGTGSNEAGDLKTQELLIIDETPFECSDCGKIFTASGNLNIQLKPTKCSDCGKISTEDGDSKTQLLHIDEKPFKCTNCGKKFTQDGHLKTHQCLKPFECHICDKRFKTSIELRRHTWIHTGERPYKCECGLTYTGYTSLKKHQLKFHAKGFQCSNCGKLFISAARLKVHQRMHTGEKPLKCSKFVSCNKVKEHYKDIHTVPNVIKCSACEKRFINSNDLNNHQCLSAVDCGKSLPQSFNLNAHRHLHTDESPFKCSDSGKGYTQYSNLMVHQRLHNGEKPLECSGCGKKFRNNGDLTSHRCIHTDEMAFECFDCGKKFTQAGQLKTHRCMQTGKKQYECHGCGKRFIKATELTDHQCIKTGEKPFQCVDCGKCFAWSIDLKRHHCIRSGESAHLKNS